MFRLLLTLSFICIFTAPAIAQRDPSATPSARLIQPDDQEAPRIVPSQIKLPNTMIDHSVTRERQIAIFAQKQSQARVASFLRAQNFPTLESYNLKALDAALVIVEGSPETLQLLRRELPEAVIDWNDDLSATKGPRLYAKEKIKWPGKQSCINEALKIPIGLVDGRIDRSHPAFAGQSALEKNFLDGAEPDQNHATAIASILIGNAPAQGFDGLLIGAKLYSAVVLRHATDDKQLASIVASVRGLDWLLDQNVRLINVSLAGSDNRVLIRGFETALAKGALIFAAAGNNGATAKPAYPAAIDGVFAITAVDAAGRLYAAANQGDYIDFSAPGVDIWVATPNGAGAYKSGTSYATPYVLAASALQLSKNKNISKDLLIKILNRNITAQCP